MLQFRGSRYGVHSRPSLRVQIIMKEQPITKRLESSVNIHKTNLALPSPIGSSKPNHWGIIVLTDPY